MRFFELPPETQQLFPAHGWIVSATGHRVLRLPVLRLYQVGEPTYKYFVDNQIAGIWLQVRSPTQTLRHLSVGLRELHREVREMVPEQDWLDKDPSAVRDEVLTQERERHERVGILLIAVLTLLRRLADDLMAASLPFLFEHWKSAPGLMKNAISAARVGELRKLKPRCDIAVLEDALLNRTGWFEQLRQDDGLRDILVHKPHFLQIGTGGNQKQDRSGFDWYLKATILREPGKGSGIRVINVFPALLDCIDGACGFMTQLVKSVGAIQGYAQGDYVFLSGQLNDICGCWPPVGRKRDGFPLKD